MTPETETPKPLRPLAAILEGVHSPFTAAQARPAAAPPSPSPAAPPRPLAPAGAPPAPSPADLAPPAAAFRGSIFTEDPDPPASQVPADLAAALAHGRPIIGEMILHEVIDLLQRGPGRPELLRAIALLADLLNYRPMISPRA